MTTGSACHLLQGRRALVTGAAGGIGRAVVAAFRAHGAQVLGVDVAAGGDVHACDVCDEQSVAEVFADGPFDDVVHAAGVVAVGTVAEMPSEVVRRVVEVNLIGSFLVAGAAARQAAAGATVTFVASQGGRKGGAGWSAYCASKFGLVGLCESLAQELAPAGARVNCVCPGTVETAMTRSAMRELADARDEDVGAIRARSIAEVPLGRLAVPEEVADVCVFLASPLARYVAGASIVIDGGELS